MENKKNKIENSIKSYENILERLVKNSIINNNSAGFTSKIEDIKKTIEKKKNKLTNLNECNSIKKKSTRKLGAYSSIGQKSALSVVPLKYDGDLKGSKSLIGAEDTLKGTQRNRNFKQKYKVIEQKEKIDNSYINYLKIVESIPDYMTKTLEKMPNNKGIIWRGIRLYGKLPRKDSNVYLDERKFGEMYIHEITKTHANLYRKNKNGTMGSMLSSTIRKIKKFNFDNLRGASCS